jgi:hypothetical protein
MRPSDPVTSATAVSRSVIAVTTYPDFGQFDVVPFEPFSSAIARIVAERDAEPW